MSNQCWCDVSDVSPKEWIDAPTETHVYSLRRLGKKVSRLFKLLLSFLANCSGVQIVDVVFRVLGTPSAFHGFWLTLRLFGGFVNVFQSLLQDAGVFSNSRGVLRCLEDFR